MMMMIAVGFAGLRSVRWMFHEVARRLLNVIARSEAARGRWSAAAETFRGVDGR